MEIIIIIEYAGMKLTKKNAYIMECKGTIRGIKVERLKKMGVRSK